MLRLGLLESRSAPGRVLHNPFERRKKKPKTRLGEIDKLLPWGEKVIEKDKDKRLIQNQEEIEREY